MEADESAVKVNTGFLKTSAKVGTNCSRSPGIGRSWVGAPCAVEKSSGFIGRLTFQTFFGWPHRSRLMLLPEFQGRGYAWKAQSPPWISPFFELGEDRVIHTIRPANLASQRLAKTGLDKSRSDSVAAAVRRHAK